VNSARGPVGRQPAGISRSVAQLDDIQPGMLDQRLEMLVWHDVTALTAGAQGQPHPTKGDIAMRAECDHQRVHGLRSETVSEPTTPSKNTGKRVRCMSPNQQPDNNSVYEQLSPRRAGNLKQVLFRSMNSVWSVTAYDARVRSPRSVTESCS